MSSLISTLQSSQDKGMGIARRKVSAVGSFGKYSLYE